MGCSKSKNRDVLGKRTRPQHRLATTRRTLRPHNDYYPNEPAQLQQSDINQIPPVAHMSAKAINDYQ